MTGTAITGVHPYAEEFPLASEEELQELTESVATVGLIHPLVVIGTVAGVEDGRLADGRNRKAACESAGVQPTVETRDFESDDELKEFIIGVNTTGRRDSMTVQIAAASTALILGEGKRNNRRWRRGSINEDLRLSDSSMNKAMEQSGLILDHLGREALEAVRDGDATLNGKYEEAIKKRDEANANLEWEKRIEAEERDAKAFLLETAPEYAERVDNGEFHNHVAAKSKWEHDNREEAAKRRREQEEARLEEQRRIKDLNHTYGTIANALRVIGNWGKYDTEALNRLMADYSPKYLNLEDQDRYFHTENLASAATFIDYLTKYQEQNNA